MTTNAGSGREGGRSLKQRVKTGRNRTLSQTRWLERQLNDPFVALAKREGFRSRAAFKIQEINEKFGIFKPGGRVVDLGAAPGGWSQIASRAVGSDHGKGCVVAIDLLPIDPISGVEFAIVDFLDPEAPDLVKKMLGGGADVVLSDMAANATGHKKTDHLKIMGIAELAAEFSLDVLDKGGSFVAKVLQGGTEGTLLADLKMSFSSVKHFKPKASRADSAELYVVATGFRGKIREGDDS